MYSAWRLIYWFQFDLYSAWQLDYWFQFDMYSAWRLDYLFKFDMYSAWRLGWLLLECVFKIDLGVVNLYRHIIFKIRPSVVVFLPGTAYLFVTDVSFIWCTCVFNNTAKCHRLRHTRANKFTLNKFLAGECRRHDDGGNLRSLHGDIFIRGSFEHF
jgi:hypothetical protein